MAKQQEEAVGRYEEEAVVLKARGDAIYEHYSRCEQVLTSVIEAKERLGWDEVQKRLAASDENVTADPSTAKPTRVRIDKAAGVSQGGPGARDPTQAARPNMLLAHENRLGTAVGDIRVTNAAVEE